MKIIQTVAV
jgi:hypothetical protein